ncbi:hypothetical protein [Lentzea sp. HUAS12]|uniref:hypothetical protein n=1 Tax=Lentzea sp. HUAS12 TaxID=2951806 RepID=UPI00209EB186|nr:hypothetical protein [Lentzea sp. HUAS12]USX54406.1 hypothetical protein ND450_09980 [Lentzea sp. HUAS12]
MNTCTALERAGTTASDVVAGQWFWHEPWPGYRVLLRVAATSRHGRTVRILTTDPDREVVQYRLDRPVRLFEDEDWGASLSGVLPLDEVA